MKYGTTHASECHTTIRYEPIRCTHTALEMAQWAIAEADAKAKRNGTYEESDAEWLVNRLSAVPAENMPVRQPELNQWWESQWELMDGGE